MADNRVLNIGLKKGFANKKEDKSLKKISLLGFFALTGAAIMNIFMYPTWASSGLTTILFLLIGGFLWFIPVALCAAEMATVKEWSQRGGLYNWTMMVLGKRWGWSAIFFQWFQITIVYYVLLYFSVAGMFYAAGDPQFINYGIYTAAVAAQHQAAVWAIMLLEFGVLSCLNLVGIKFNDWFSRFVLPMGVILPAMLIAIFGFWAFGTHAGTGIEGNYIVGSGAQAVIAGKHSIAWIPGYDRAVQNAAGNYVGVIPFSVHTQPTGPGTGGDNLGSIVPQTGDTWTNMTMLVIFSNFIISYTGIEQSASLIRKMKNPGRDYPIAALMIALLIIILGICGSSAMALTMYNLDLESLNGVYDYFLQLIVYHNIFHMSYAGSVSLFKFMCFLVLLGGMCEANAVIIEPSTGIYGGFVNMRFPRWFLKVNRNDVHYNILIMQGCLMFFWVTLVNFISLNALGFQICVNLAVLTYMTAYLLLYTSYIGLYSNKRFKYLQKQFQLKPSALKVTVSWIGFLLTILVIIFTISPPSFMTTPSAANVLEYTTSYVPVIVVLYPIIVSVPFVSYELNFYRVFKKPILSFLKEKGFDDATAKRIWVLYKKDKTNPKIGRMLATLGVPEHFVNYYYEHDPMMRVDHHRFMQFATQAGLSKQQAKVLYKQYDSERYFEEAKMQLTALGFKKYFPDSVDCLVPPHAE